MGKRKQKNVREVCLNLKHMVPSAYNRNHSVNWLRAMGRAAAQRRMELARSGTGARARTDRQYYSSYAPDLANRSAGKLFLGSYSVDKSGFETYNEGIAFRSRPTAVSGIYTFVQDYHDTSETGLVVISLVNDEDGKEVEIGRGVGYLKPSTSFTRFNVPVVYSIRNKRATRLKLMVASSNHASYSIEKESRNIKTSDYLETAVSTGAELTVDQLSLLYE